MEMADEEWVYTVDTWVTFTGLLVHFEASVICSPFASGMLNKNVPALQVNTVPMRL